MDVNNISVGCASANQETRSLSDAYEALAAAEEVAWDRIGGPSAEDHANIKAIELEIGDRPADCAVVFLWRVNRLSRAIANDWDEVLLRRLAERVVSDTQTFVLRSIA